jgi:predicted secreted hydrolase
VDPNNHGTWVDPSGTARHLEAGEFSLDPVRSWRSPETGAEYPVAWRLRVPALAVDLEVEAVLDRQELVLEPVVYWEGALKVGGSHKGRGFLEMTGYAGQVRGLR